MPDQDISRQLNSLQEDITSIKKYLLGDEFGTEGVVDWKKRIEEEVEEDRRKISKIKWMLAGAVLVLAPVAAIIGAVISEIIK